MDKIEKKKFEKVRVRFPYVIGRTFVMMVQMIISIKECGKNERG